MFASINAVFSPSQKCYSSESLEENPIHVTQEESVATTNSPFVVNYLLATFAGFISRILIERNFFQSTKLPAETILYLTNDLIHILSPRQKTHTFNIPKEASLLWKQFRGQPLSSEDKAYIDYPKNIDVPGEIFNGLKYSSMALMGQHLYSSVTSAVTGQLWDHIPAICGYFGVAVAGPQALAHAVTRVLQKTSLTHEQQLLLGPWLNTVGRSVLGLIPKVHATEQGVHYQYPSFHGHSQTFSTDQTVALRGNTLSIEKTKHFQTPRGSFEGTYTADFKLGQFYELSEEHIRIEVIDKNGISVPIVFTKTFGQYGPEIVVSCENKALERDWSQYFQPKQIASSAPEIELQNRFMLSLPRLSEYQISPFALSTFYLSAGVMMGKFAGHSALTPALFMISLPKIVDASQVNDEVPVGFIMPYASSGKTPEEMGYLRCDGEKYLKADYRELYEALKGHCEEEGESFQVPDYRGLFLRGANQLEDIGKYSEDSTRMPRMPFQVTEEGTHRHVAQPSGEHNHITHPAGEHSHKMDTAGKHDHTINTRVYPPELYCRTVNDHHFPNCGYMKDNAKADLAGAHVHNITSGGAHFHETNNGGVHVHGIHESGAHIHDITGGDKETSPKNKQVAYWIKAKKMAQSPPEETSYLPTITMLTAGLAGGLFVSIVRSINKLKGDINALKKKTNIGRLLQNSRVCRFPEYFEWRSLKFCSHHAAVAFALLSCFSY